MNTPTVTLELDLDEVIPLRADDDPPLRFGAGYGSVVYVVTPLWDDGRLVGHRVVTVLPKGRTVEMKAVDA